MKELGKIQKWLMVMLFVLVSSISYAVNPHEMVFKDSIPVFDTVFVSVCDSFVYEGGVIHESGIYELHFQNQSEDSLVYLDLNVRHSSETSGSAIACDSFSWNGESYSQTGEYTQQFVNLEGCDSIHTLRLRIFYSSESHDTVSECNSYFWSNETLTVSDFYVRHYTNSKGCDSTATLLLILHYDTLIETSQVACDWYQWTNLIRYRMSGTHTYHTTSPWGCDITHQLHLTIYPSANVIDRIDACDSLLWDDGNLYTHDNHTSKQYLTTSHGCDSIVTLNLTIHHADTTTVFDTIVQNQLPYLYNGDYYYSDTSDVETVYQSIYNCDSLIYFNLFVWPNVSGGALRTICDNSLPYVWNGIEFTESGVQSATLLASSGADSVVVMQLEVKPTYDFYDTVVLCPSSPSYFWMDSTYFPELDTNNYVTNLLSGDLCDSIFHLHLERHYNSYDTIMRIITVEDLPFQWMDTLLTQSDTVTFSYPNMQGCDSLLTLILSTSGALTTFLDTIVCQSALPFEWEGEIFSFAGQKEVVYQSQYGVDSIVTLTLHVHSIEVIPINDTCYQNQLPRAYLDTLFYEEVSGLHYFYLNQFGCDSLNSYSLTIIPNIHHSVDTIVCGNHIPISWNNRLCFTDTTFSDTLAINEFQDSIVHYHFVVAPIYSASQIEEICSSALPVEWHGILISEGTFYEEKLIQDTSSLGCDSVTKLELHVIDAIQNIIFDTILENSLPYYNGLLSFNSDTNAHIIYISQDGCDSIVNLNLKVIWNQHVAFDTIVCSNHLPISWMGHMFVQADTISLIFQSQQGSDSIVSLTLHTYPVNSLEINEQICRSSLPVNWNGVVFDTNTQSSDMTLHFPNTLGCDSINILHLTIIPSDTTLDFQTHCDSLEWNQTTYYASTSAPMKHLTSQWGCDSVVNLHLTIHHAASGVDEISNCGPITWMDGETYYSSTNIPVVHIGTTFGCDSTVELHFHFYQKDTTFIQDHLCKGSDYFFNGQQISEGGEYFSLLTNSSGCDSMVYLQLELLEPFTAEFTTTHNCNTGNYTITANTDAHYLRWDSEPYDETITPQTNQNSITVHPETFTTYSLYMDYDQIPTCPSTQSIELRPLHKPKAKIEVNPPFLTFDNSKVIAFDRSEGNSSRMWYIDEIPYSTSSRIEYISGDVDSLVLMLEAVNGVCIDSAYAVIPMRHESIYIPNAFTPEETDNNIFIPKGRGILQFEMYVFTREGQQIFYTNSLDRGWDGTYQGLPMQQQAYVYRILYTSEIMPRVFQERRGTILLLR